MNSHPVSRISHLDGLRGVAILAVLLFHAYSRWSEVEPYNQNTFVVDFFSQGWLGVQLFFAISGFVIYMSLENSEGIVSFAKKRWLRLFPVMFVASLIIYITAPYIPYRPAGAPSVIDFLPGIIFVDPWLVGNILGKEVSSLDGVFWSLYVEVRFYLVSAFFYFLLKDKKLNVVLFLFLSYIFFGLLAKFDFIAEWGFVNNIFEFLNWLGAGYFGWFLVGIYSYLGVKMGGYHVAILFVGIISICLLAYKNEDVWITFFGSSLVFIVFVSSFKLTILASFLSARVFVFFGFISYPLYLIHQNFVTGLSIQLYHFNDSFHAYLYPLIIIPVVVVIAFLLARLEPVLRALLSKRFYSRIVRHKSN